MNIPRSDISHVFHSIDNSCSWDERTIRRLIADGKLAARLVGTDQDPSFLPKASQHDMDSSTVYLQECPICFLQYTQINVATCCAASICTECYLQVHPHTKETPVTCPFCNTPGFDVQVAKQLDGEYVLHREEEEQKVIESTIRARTGFIRDSSNDDTATPDESVDSVTATSSSFETSLQGDEFGSSLVRRLRARTESLSAQDSVRHNSIMTVSPEERHQLEMEMRDQKSHPLVRMLELEAEETRHRHELEHSERVSRNRFRRRGSLGRRLIQQTETSGNMNENTNQENSNREQNSNNSRDIRDDGLRMLETALFIAMEERSLRDRVMSSGSMNLVDYDGSDSPHADAIALLQELLSRRQQLRERQATGSSNARANQRRLGLEAQLEAATNMLLSILPEEDQIAMAMAMSLSEADVAQDEISSVEETVVATPASETNGTPAISESEPNVSSADTGLPEQSDTTVSNNISLPLS